MVWLIAQGIKVLANPPDRISKLYLRQYPGFAEFSDSGKSDPGDADKDNLSEQSPDERMGSLYTEIRDALADELLQKIKSCFSVFFEQLVVALLLAMGYGGLREDAGQATGSGGDNGVDSIIKEDRLGLDVIYIQAKRWDNTVVSRFLCCIIDLPGFAASVPLELQSSFPCYCSRPLQRSPNHLTLVVSRL